MLFGFAGGRAAQQKNVDKIQCLPSKSFQRVSTQVIIQDFYSKWHFPHVSKEEKMILVQVQEGKDYSAFLLEIFIEFHYSLMTYFVWCTLFESC